MEEHTRPQPRLSRAELEYIAENGFTPEDKPWVSLKITEKWLASEALALMDERDQLQHRFDGLAALADTRIKGLIKGTDPASPLPKLEAERDAYRKALEQIQAVFYQTERSDHDAAYTMKELARAALSVTSTKIGA